MRVADSVCTVYLLLMRFVGLINFAQLLSFISQVQLPSTNTKYRDTASGASLLLPLITSVPPPDFPPPRDLSLSPLFWPEMICTHSSAEKRVREGITGRVNWWQPL